MSEIEAATSNGETMSLDEELLSLGANLDLHVKVGGMSLTVTRKEQETVLLAPSLAEKATVVAPKGKALPEARPEVRVTVRLEEQLSVSVGEAYVNILVHSFAASDITVSLAHFNIFGRIVSIIVTAVVH